MKTNAIVRIILFSLAIIILSGILLAGLVFNLYAFRYESENMEESMLLTAGGLPAMHIQNLEIDWVAGNIQLVPGETNGQILFSESGAIDPDDQLVYSLEGDTLSIQFSKEKHHVIGFGINKDISKDLTITVPLDWVCNKLDIETASANLTVQNLTIEEVEFDGASGLCVFDDCAVTDMDIETASGYIRYNGILTRLQIKAASANCEINAENIPEKIDLNSMSGDLELTLPANCGFTVEMDAMSSDFSSDFPTTTQNNCHVHGDGRCYIRVDAMSGDVKINKGA